ncbi:hypothetical protein FPS10_19270 [Pseudoruegeria sp. M32A2M]|nr:hypothetical protein [Pseudoruegeria sp. M32A2M]
MALLAQALHEICCRLPIREPTPYPAGFDRPRPGAFLAILQLPTLLNGKREQGRWGNYMGQRGGVRRLIAYFGACRCCQCALRTEQTRCHDYRDRQFSEHSAQVDGKSRQGVHAKAFLLHLASGYLDRVYERLPGKVLAVSIAKKKANLRLKRPIHSVVLNLSIWYR